MPETPIAILPDQWRAAYERDCQGVLSGNDPAPERKAGRVLAAFILSGLVFLALPGTFLGVWNLLTISSKRASEGASMAWIQSHGQAQLFGWVGTFILGISLYALPKFLGRVPRRFGAMWVVWLLWTLGAAWRWWSGVSGWEWRVGLAGSAILEFIAYSLAQYILWFDRGEKHTNHVRAGVKNFPGDLASWLGVVGFASFGIDLVLNLGISFKVALHGAAPIYPALGDRTFLILALWGFVIPVAWGYSTRFVKVFAGLANPAQSAARWLGAGIAAIVIFALLRQFFLADILALGATLVAVWALRVFLPAAAEPKRAARVYSHFPLFIRAAYVWLVVGAALGVCADLAPHITGLGGASRHALTVGFIATLIFCVAPLILPSFMNGRQLFSSRIMAASLWLLTLGCLLRVSSEAVAYSSGGISWRMLPVSAFIELAAVFLFVLNLAFTLIQPMPAWFSPAGVSARMPVYFYVTSFPKTRRVLINSGLTTLERIREVPRTLTLDQAAEADGADVERLLAGLREFFARRQPRR